MNASPAGSPTSRPDGRAEPPLLQVRDLQTHLFTKAGVLKAVDGVSFTLNRGECLGLVGESGSGKSLTCLSIIQLLPEQVARIVSGSIRFEGTELVGASHETLRQIRGRRISLILQDPMTSLNPAFTIGDQILESVRLRFGGPARAAWQQVVSALESVKIPAAAERARAFPHQVSGGMRQRVVGAMAIAGQADLLIADEPTTALDVTIQAEYLALLDEFRRSRGMAILFVTHDLNAVAQLCDRVAVMYGGRIVEQADVFQIFEAPAHPYTRALLTSIPSVEERAERLLTIEGQPPDLRTLPTGCAFAPRCGQALVRCQTEMPPVTPLGSGHEARCWLLEP